MNPTLQSANPLKLYQVLLGCNLPNRYVEQHDYFFGIGGSLKELVPEMKAFWPEAGNTIHIDGWREVTHVEGYAITVVTNHGGELGTTKKLFFINLGGYQTGKLEEQHYTILTVQDNRQIAAQSAKKTAFFKTNTIKGAGSHIDEKFGIDVDDVYQIEDILSLSQKEKYHILVTPIAYLPDDQINLGYLKLDKVI